jgi:Rv2525c-like, glycoside hydrolase-like domain
MGRACGAAVALALTCAIAPAPAASGPPLKSIRYHGYSVLVPSSWPVVDLLRDPHACVRFDRRAVYLGVPGSQQRCPAHAAGRPRAILIEPAGASAAGPGSGRVRVLRSAAQTGGGRSGGDPATARAASAPVARAASAYTGLGFDACATPSTRTMSAWSASPYRAIGVYIGGVNSACAQSNLSRSWVATEASAGWHLIPIYVGLQAPSNSCGCSGITPSRASSQGRAAADDAVSDAQQLGIPSGNPVYFDMESYPPGGGNSTAVMTFLAAWTAELHAKGYVSGVYSSASTGVSDLAARYHSGYTEPDDLWIADWNDRKTTSDPYVPASDWSDHRRLHQYSGAHNETFGGATVNIDSDYLDGATAGTTGGDHGTPPPPTEPPTVSVSAAPDGTASIRVSWPGGRGLTAWRVLAGVSRSGLSVVAVARARGTRAVIRVPNGSPYFAAQALGSGGRVLASTRIAAAPAHLAVFGHAAFVSPTGIGGIPAGCYTGRTCHIASTVRVGAVVIAQTGTESIHTASTGILYFSLNQTGLFMLANSRGGRLPVQVSLRDTAGTGATVSLSLIGFTTTGPTPIRSVRQAPPVQFLGATDFIPERGLGGILAACGSPTPCHIAATVSIAGVTVARTGTETIGGEEAGYVFFPLSGRGRRLLADDPGNHVPAAVSLAAGATVARGTIALVSFS